MLQIASGRFFTSSDQYVHECRGVLYSNVSWIQSIDSSAGTLRPLPSASRTAWFVLDYQNRMEKGGVLVQSGDAEYVEQYSLLCMLGLEGYFATQQAQVENVCRSDPSSPLDYSVPRKLLPEFLDYRIATKQNIDRFVGIVERAINLPRSDFRTLISCLQAVKASIEVVGFNIDLAYSLLVYGMESLSSQTELGEPSWDDYNPDIRARLDPLMSELPDAIERQLKDALLSAPSTSIQRRFIDYFCEQLKPEFFSSECAKTRRPLRPSQVREALRQAYAMRSKFVHQLRPIQEQLRWHYTGTDEVVTWGGTPYLTYPGLMRIFLFALESFLAECDQISSENINWSAELPGTIRGELSPKYWIDRVESFTPEQATRRFSGILILLDQSEDEIIPNLEKLLQHIEKVYGQAKRDYRPSMLGLYWVYNSVLSEEDRVPGYERFLERHIDHLLAPSIEMLTAHTLLRSLVPWDTVQCWQIYRDFDSSRNRRHSIRLPQGVEVLLLVAISIRAAWDGFSILRLVALQVALYEAAGHPGVQRTILDACSTAMRELGYIAEPLPRAPSEGPTNAAPDHIS